MTKYYIAFIKIREMWFSGRYGTSHGTLLFDEEKPLTIGDIERAGRLHYSYAKEIEVVNFYEISFEEYLRNLNDGEWQDENDLPEWRKRYAKEGSL